MLLPGQLGDPATARAEWPSIGNAARGEPVSGDRMIRFATAAVVCAVAAFAAVVSYSHIYGLGRVHGQDGTAARLLPLSTFQGTIVSYLTLSTYHWGFLTTLFSYSQLPGVSR